MKFQAIFILGTPIVADDGAVCCLLQTESGWGPGSLWSKLTHMRESRVVYSSRTKCSRAPGRGTEFMEIKMKVELFLIDV